MFLLFLIFWLSVGRRVMLDTGLAESAQLCDFDLIHCAFIDPSPDGDYGPFFNDLSVWSKKLALYESTFASRL